LDKSPTQKPEKKYFYKTPVKTLKTREKSSILWYNVFAQNHQKERAFLKRY
jgi:hypothetical protein